MLSLLKAGKLGNTVQTWDDPSQVPAHLRERGRFGIRYRRVGDTRFVLEKTYQEILELWDGDPQAYVSESIDVNDIYWQAQVSRDAYGWVVEHSREKASHRKALLSGFETTTGWQALRLLRSNLDPASFDDLMGLFDQYDIYEDSFVVELSCFTRSYGVLNRPTIFWEARHY